MPGKKWIKSPLKKYWNGKRGEKTTKATHLKISRFEGKRVRVAGFSNLVVFSVSLFSKESGVFELVFEGFHPLFIWQAPVLQHLAHTACLSKDLCYQEQIFLDFDHDDFFAHSGIDYYRAGRSAKYIHSFPIWMTFSATVVYGQAVWLTGEPP